jgi:hypothetical protein
MRKLLKVNQLHQAMQLIRKVGRSTGDLSLVADAALAADPNWKKELIRRVQLHDEAAAKKLRSLNW